MTLMYNKRLNERHYVTLGKQWNPFPAEASSRTSLGELMTLPRPLGWLGSPL